MQITSQSLYFGVGSKQGSRKPSPEPQVVESERNKGFKEEDVASLSSVNSKTSTSTAKIKTWRQRVINMGYQLSQWQGGAERQQKNQKRLEALEDLHAENKELQRVYRR